MSVQDRETILTLQQYVPRRSVYADHVVLRQFSADVLVIQWSIWSRAAFLALAIAVGYLSSTFLYWSFQPWKLDELRFTDERLLAGTFACMGVVFSLALAAATLFKGPIRIYRTTGTVARGGWFPGWWRRNLAEVLAIQICRGKSDVTHGERAHETTVTLQYQVNFVFRDSPPSRRNICEQKDRFSVVQLGRQIADFLHVPLLNYVGPVGTMEAADTELRRLLNQTLPVTATIRPDPRA
jgi:hypothetical protein